jgi:predicted O-methyltransferase YrrM
LASRDFKEFSRRVLEVSYSLGIPSINEDEGYILYALTYTLLHGRGSCRGFRIADLGAGAGYSTIWFAKALSDYGCVDSSIVLVDIDGVRLGYAEKLLSEYGFRGVVFEYVVADAIDYLRRSSGYFDIVFIDIAKHQYVEAFRSVYPLMRRGSLIIYHNAIFPPPPSVLYDVIKNAGLHYVVIPTENGLLIVFKD